MIYSNQITLQWYYYVIIIAGNSKDLKTYDNKKKEV